MSEYETIHYHGSPHGRENIYKELCNENRFVTAAEFFKVLSDATRVRLFWLLSHREECIVNISTLFHMSGPAISHHLRLLAENNLIESRREGKEVYYRAADSEQADLLHEILEQVMEMACPKDADAAQATAEEIVREVHAYLTEHLSERITIEALSKEFLLNTTTLKQTFKKVYGTSLAAHVKEHRMKQAAKLLSETDRSIGAIASDVGYESQSKFSTAFRECFGVLPSDYRKKF